MCVTKRVSRTLLSFIRRSRLFFDVLLELFVRYRYDRRATAFADELITLETCRRIIHLSTVRTAIIRENHSPMMHYKPFGHNTFNIDANRSSSEKIAT